MRGNVINLRFFLGDWDTALALGDEFIAECETSPHYKGGGVRNVRSYIRFARGDTAGAFEHSARALAQAREIKDPQSLLPSLLGSVRLHAMAGRLDVARELATEALGLVREHIALAGNMHHSTFALDVLGLREEVIQLLELAPPGPWVEATMAEAQGVLPALPSSMRPTEHRRSRPSQACSRARS